MSGTALAQIGPGSIELINRLCAQTLRVDEEDRPYGMIGLSVRATISYRGGQFQRNVIDDAVHNSLDELLAACPNLAAVDASKRVDLAIDIISDTTTRVLERTGRRARAATRRAAR